MKERGGEVFNEKYHISTAAEGFGRRRKREKRMNQYGNFIFQAQ